MIIAMLMITVKTSDFFIRNEIFVMSKKLFEKSFLLLNTQKAMNALPEGVKTVSCQCGYYAKSIKEKFENAACHLCLSLNRLVVKVL